MQINRYIALLDIPQDEFISNRYFINYLNIGRTSEMRLNDISVHDPKCLKNCIVYLDNEVEILKKYHPDVIIAPYISRVIALNKIIEDDLDVLN